MKRPVRGLRLKKAYFHPKSLVEDRSSVGRGTRVWAFAHVLRGARIGEDCNICDHCFVEGGSLIGNRVTLKNGVAVWDRVTIEDDAFIGPNAVFTNVLRPVSRAPIPFEPTRIGRGACIGANATVVCGRTVGTYAFVGAGSVVTRNLPDFCLAYGNPARVRGHVCRCRRALRFRGGRARCGICGAHYLRRRGAVRPVSR